MQHSDLSFCDQTSLPLSRSVSRYSTATKSRSPESRFRHLRYGVCPPPIRFRLLPASSDAPRYPFLPCRVTEDQAPDLARIAQDSAGWQLLACAQPRGFWTPSLRLSVLASSAVPPISALGALSTPASPTPRLHERPSQYHPADTNMVIEYTDLRFASLARDDPHDFSWSSDDFGDRAHYLVSLFFATFRDAAERCSS